MEFVKFLWTASHGLNGFVIELFICELIFTLPAKLRRYWYVTIPLSVVAYFAFGWIVRYIPFFGPSTASVYCIMIFSLSIGLQQLCFSQSLSRSLFNSSAAYILQNLALNLKEAITLKISVMGWRVLTEIVVTAAVYVIYYFLFARRSKNKAVNLKTLYAVIIALVSVLVGNILFTLSSFSGFSQDQIIMVRCVLALCCNLALFSQFMVIHSTRLNKEKDIVEQLLVTEQKQHKMSQENIDLINIKSHDLKKQIGMLRRSVNNGELNELFNEVENAVSVYDESVKTGNANLDLVLTEKQLYCKKHSIRIDIMADGKQLDFMSPTDIYSLFGNALDNAIESVLELEEEKRIITMEVRRKGDLVSVTISNACKNYVVFSNGIPLTSKLDKKYHGFGTRSMKYVVEKYGGNIVFEEKDENFSVHMLFDVKN